jgi:hypothetical protein
MGCDETFKAPGIPYVPPILTFRNSVFCPQCIYVFVWIWGQAAINFSLQHSPTGFYNRSRDCLLRGTNWVFKSDGYSFVLKDWPCCIRRMVHKCWSVRGDMNMMQRVFNLNEADLLPLSGSRMETVVCSSRRCHVTCKFHRLDIEEGFLITVTKRLYCWNLTSHRINRNYNSMCKWVCSPSDATGPIICCHFGDKSSSVSSSSDLAVLVRCLESLYILVVKCVKHGDEMRIGVIRYQF